MASVVLVNGCSQSKPKPSATSKSSSSKSKTRDNKRLCESSLENILSVVDLENLSSVFQRSNGVLFFNEWKAECQVEEDLKLSKRSLELLKEYFSEESMERLLKSDFDGRDVEHLRIAKLFRRMAINAIEGTETDLERTVALFELSIRNISITPAFAANVPRTPYDAMLFSLGGVEDRTWIFSILLRQIHIDSLLIRPDKNSTRFLIGVPLDGQVYLFDPSIGVPVASTDDKNAFVKKPATLTEIRKDPKVLSQFTFDSETKYPLVDSDFSKVQIDLIGDSSLWAPRMEPFESRLKGDETCSLYSAIESTDSDQELGEINRIVKNGGLDEKNVSWGIWPFPEEMLIKYENPTEQEKAFMSSVRQSFDMIFGKVVKNKDDSQSVEEVKSDRVFLKSRTRHLIGDYDSAVPSYMKFRSGANKLRKQKNIGNSPQASLAFQMGEQAHYWTGLCQFELENFEAAINTMENSLRDYPTGIQSGPARIVKALAEAKVNQLNEAIESFEGVPDTSPEYDLARYYIKRWKNVAKSEKVKVEEKPEMKSEKNTESDSPKKVKDADALESSIPPAPKKPKQEK